MIRRSNSRSPIAGETVPPLNCCTICVMVSCCATISTARFCAAARAFSSSRLVFARNNRDRNVPLVRERLGRSLRSLDFRCKDCLNVYVFQRMSEASRSLVSSGAEKRIGSTRGFLSVANNEDCALIGREHVREKIAKKILMKTTRLFIIAPRSSNDTGRTQAAHGIQSPNMIGENKIVAPVATIASCRDHANAGMIGGLGPESTIDYYRSILRFPSPQTKADIPTSSSTASMSIKASPCWTRQMDDLADYLAAE